MIDATFFAGNRERLSEQCQGIIVLTAYNALQSSGDMAALFRQEANFWYVTGIGDPDWQLIMHDGKSWLVAPDISEAHKVFDGGMSHETAQIISGVDEIINYSEASALLTHLARKYQIVCTLEQDPYQKYYNFTCNPAPGKLRRQLHRHFNEVRDCRQELATLRARKQPEEIACITRAVQLTMQAFSGVKQHLDTYAHEYEVAAMFDYEFRRHNATHAYEPIVAGGANACTLHYNANSAALASSSLLLLDIGARVEGYPADITRTYAIGERTRRQVAVHAAVTAAHHDIIRQLRPGLSIFEYQEYVTARMKQALKTLDLLSGAHEVQAYRRYFPHAISHGLGVDVHDSLGGAKEFAPGMVLTVEPGIYIPEESIGVRLEDDIIITDKGHQNISESLSLDL